MLCLLGLVSGAFIASPLHAPQLAEQHHARALLPRAAPSAIVFDLGDLLGRKFGVQPADVFGHDGEGDELLSDSSSSSLSLLFPLALRLLLHPLGPV